MHPWEDFAETFAHDLHMIDMLDTARAHGMTVRLSPAPGQAGAAEAVSSQRVDPRDFAALLAGFVPLTLTVNDLNRSMGLSDPYPFVLSPPAIAKLRFVHDLIVSAANA
jgi:hypothetical protein